jgi:hypothetical protein
MQLMSALARHCTNLMITASLSQGLVSYISDFSSSLIRGKGGVIVQWLLEGYFEV